MKRNKGETAKFIYGICLSVLTAVVATAFIVQVWAIYRSSASDPFTVAVVSKKFSQIALPVWLWIVAIVGGGVLSYVFPEQEERPKAFVETKLALTRLKNRLPQEGEGWEELQKHSRVRTVVWSVCAALCAVSLTVSLVYLFDLDYTAAFKTEFYKTHVEAEKFVKIFPWVLGAFAVCVGACVYETYSVKKETQRAKALLAENAKKGIKPVAKEEQAGWLKRLQKKFAFVHTEKFILGVRISLAVVGVVFVVVGIVNGGMADVLTKAVNLCKQCIGLG